MLKKYDAEWLELIEKAKALAVVASERGSDVRKVEAAVRRQTIRLRNKAEEEMQGIVQGAYREISSCFNDFQGKMLGEIQVRKKIRFLLI